MAPTKDMARTTLVLRRTFTAFSLSLLGVTWLAALLIRYREAFVVAMAVVMVAFAVVLVRLPGNGRLKNVGAGVGLVGAVAGIIWVVGDLYSGWLIALISAFALTLGCAVGAWRLRARDARSFGRLALRGTAGAGGIVAALISALLVVFSAAPAPFAQALQASSGASNSFEPAAQEATTVASGARLTTDIQYATTYPNSYLDVYIADNDPSVSRPTYVIIHGGGFIAGSKSEGDPNAGGDYFALGGGPMLENGYNIVSIGYALAPQYPYPTPVIQLGEAMEFLQEHGAEYGLDMSRMVLSGGSAGGHIAAQYAAIQTNSAYSQQTGIAQTADPGSIKAVVLDSAALDPARAGATQDPVLVADLIFDLSGRAYVGTAKEQLAESDLVAHVDENFPPSFIADGNTGTFPDQARDLAERLDVLGVPNGVYLPPTSEAVLGHGFMASGSQWTDKYNDLKIDFLAGIVQ